MAKTASPSGAATYSVGEVITYSFAVTNPGNVALTDVAVSDTDFSGTGTLTPIVCPITTLFAGVAETCSATYTVTQADVDAGSITNTATATGTPPSGDGPPPVSPPSTVVIPSPPQPGLTIVKTANVTKVTTAGQKITYSFVITNTGDVTETNVEPAEGTFTGTGTLSTPVCPVAAASLAPGDTVTCTATYTVTAADLRADTLANTATAVGITPNGPNGSPPSTVTVSVDPPAPATPAAPAPGTPALAFTGSNLIGPLTWALALLLAGLSALTIRTMWVRRRNQNGH